ncbi:hypothetical protein CLOM_g18333 [Closterium sp. NIES-68]|nr:hypothetical protein CLOM_g18333 [Closterium sp. NIES-68]GJP65814.1 hypothetical protein CLOP_g22730 [Closterium sp. NIES-67]
MSARVYDKDGLVDFEASFPEEDKSWLCIPPPELPFPKKRFSLPESEACLEREFWRDYSEEDQTWLSIPPESSLAFDSQTQCPENAARRNQIRDCSSSSGSVLSAVTCTGESTPTGSSASSDRSVSISKVFSNKEVMGEAHAQEVTPGVMKPLTSSIPAAEEKFQGRISAAYEKPSRPAIAASSRVAVGGLKTSMRPVADAQSTLLSTEAARRPVKAAHVKAVNRFNAAEKSRKPVTRSAHSEGAMKKNATAAAVGSSVKPVNLHGSFLESTKPVNAAALAVVQKSGEAVTPPDRRMKHTAPADKAPAVSCDGSTIKMAHPDRRMKHTAPADKAPAVSCDGSAMKMAHGRMKHQQSVQAAFRASVDSEAAMVTPPAGEALRRLASSVSRIPQPTGTTDSRKAAVIPMSVPVKARATSAAPRLEGGTGEITPPRAVMKTPALKFGFGKSTKTAYSEWRSAVSRKDGHA